MKNKLTDLNDHLFAQIERLSDENLTPEQIEQEARRGNAIVGIADQIIRGAELQLKAAALLASEGQSFVGYLPRIGGDAKMTKWIRYSDEELAWIEANATLPRAELHAAFLGAFGRDDVSPEHLVSLRKRRGWRTGRTGRWAKGSAPSNKGKRMESHPNSARTQFKKGNSPPNITPLGHERLDKTGYVWVAIAETNPYTGRPRRYVMKHLHLWQKVNGPLPAGMCLKSIDGDRTNTDPSNWMAIPRAMLPRLNGVYGRGYDIAPAELKPVIMATAKLEHIVRTKSAGAAS